MPFHGFELLFAVRLLELEFHSRERGGTRLSTTPDRRLRRRWLVQSALVSRTEQNLQAHQKKNANYTGPVQLLQFFNAASWRTCRVKMRLNRRNGSLLNVFQGPACGDYAYAGLRLLPALYELLRELAPVHSSNARRISLRSEKLHVELAQRHSQKAVQADKNLLIQRLRHSHEQLLFAESVHCNVNDVMRVFAGQRNYLSSSFFARRERVLRLGIRAIQKRSVNAFPTQTGQLRHALVPSTVARMNNASPVHFYDEHDGTGAVVGVDQRHGRGHAV